MENTTNTTNTNTTNQLKQSVYSSDCITATLTQHSPVSANIDIMLHLLDFDFQYNVPLTICANDNKTTIDANITELYDLMPLFVCYMRDCINMIHDICIDNYGVRANIIWPSAMEFIVFGAKKDEYIHNYRYKFKDEDGRKTYIIDRYEYIYQDCRDIIYTYIAYVMKDMDNKDIISVIGVTIFADSINRVCVIDLPANYGHDIMSSVIDNLKKEMQCKYIDYCVICR